MILNMRQTDGITNVLANPRIRVRNREKAKVHIGDRVPVVTTTSTVSVGTSSSVSYLDVGLKLEVEPTIYLEGDVAMKVALEVSNIVKEVPTTGGGLAYQIGTRNASTLLRLKDGETQILAGLIQDEERSAVNRVPLIGELPVVGRLFSNNLENRNKSEIVLLITPRVVRNLYRPDHVASEYYSGTEAAVGALPLTIGATKTGAMAVSGRPGPGAAAARPEATRTGSDAPRAAATTTAPAVLTLDVPAQATVGKDISVRITMAEHPDAVNATVQIDYDSALLAPAEGVDVSAIRLVKTGSGPVMTEVRFRVIAKEAGKTRLQLEGINVSNAAGDVIPASVPPPGEISIIP
jgi:general secretion pathway protein D